MAKKRVSRKIKTKKPVVVESGKEFQEIEEASKRIATRKFRVPKPESLTEKDEDGGISEGTGETPLAEITMDDIAPLTSGQKKKKKATRKIKRKKKK